jgi:hypothetical protein
VTESPNKSLVEESNGSQSDLELSSINTSINNNTDEDQLIKNDDDKSSQGNEEESQ